MQIKRLGHRQLALHFAAQIQTLRSHGRHEAAIAVSETAVSIAIEIFGKRREQAVAFLTSCEVKYAGHLYDRTVAGLAKVA